MNNPIISFTISVLIWLSIIILFSYFSLKNKNDLNPEITVDAKMVGELVEEKKRPVFKKIINKKLHKEDQISDLKKVQEKSKELHHDHHYQENKKSQQAKAKILYRPLPKIPYDLRREAFKTRAIARFYVNKDGSVNKLELIKASNNPRLNFLLIKQLKKWKFEEKGKDFTQDVKVSFQVK